MRGHMAIQELRRMGKKPVQAWVFLITQDQLVPGFIDPEELLESAMLPEVWVGPDEDPNTLDFRFLVGVTVHLQSQNIDRLRDAFARIRACKPKRIIASGAAFFDTEQHA